jgi:hypothetical protein
VTEPYRDKEQEEKVDEKEVAKQEEKWEEKWHRDPLGTVVGAVMLMWLGVVLLANNLGLLDLFADLLERFGLRSARLPWEMPFVTPEAWSLFFFGGGLILLLEIVVRLVVPTYRRNVLGTLIVAIVFFALGLGNWSLIWPLIVIAIGLSVLLRGLFRRE